MSPNVLTISPPTSGAGEAWSHHRHGQQVRGDASLEGKTQTQEEARRLVSDNLECMSLASLTSSSGRRVWTKLGHHAPQK